VHRRPLAALVAAAITVSTFAGATAANAAPASGSPASLTGAAAQARADASAALAGLVLPSASRVRAAAASTNSFSLPLDTTVPVKVAAKHYDIHVVSTGAKTDRTTITLFLGGRSAQVSVRRLVRVTVLRHGYKHPLMQTTTTFKRFVVMLTGLESNPLKLTSVHFSTRSDFVAALSHGLAIDSHEVNREYGALLRFVQMALDLSSTLLQAVDYAEKNPAATDFSGATTVQTTAGSGAYAGTVTLSGAIVSGVPQSFSVSVTNTTDASALTESFDAKAITMTYTVGGRTYTQSVSLTV
jgi:hypothetical protein